MPGKRSGYRYIMNLRANISVCFRSQLDNAHFLFQVLNVGKLTDELKFVFTDRESGVGGVYTHGRDRYDQGDIVRFVPEVSYHSDGSLLFKMPSYSKRTDTVYRNPQQLGYKRTPLSEISRWEGFLVYTVHNYELCRKSSISSPLFLAIDPSWFDGAPFEYRLFLGSKSCPTPIASQEILVQRVNQISNQVDLLILLAKITARGFPMHIGTTDTVVWSTNNIIEVIPYNPASKS